MNMQYYDLVMVLVLVGATIFGFWKGMAWQLASLASLVVSFFVAAKFRNQLAPMFGQQAPMNQFAAMLAIYAGSSFVIWMAFRFVAGAIDKVKLQAFDKQMGALFGFAKGVLLCVAITFFAVTLLPPAQGQAIVNSQSGHYIVAFLNRAETMVPPEYHQVIVPYLDKVEERISTGNPNGGSGFQLGWPGSSGSATNTSAAPGGWPQISWPSAQSQTSQPQTSQPQSGWPQQPASSQQNAAPGGWPAQSPASQLGWPSTTQSQPGPAQPVDQTAWPTQQAGQMQPALAPPAADPYGPPREPNPFPDPGYSAERPAGATY